MNTMTTPIPSTNQPDVVLVGAGIMSATLAVILKELDPGLKIEIHEVLASEAQESSNAWNNAGTGHAALVLARKEANEHTHSGSRAVTLSMSRSGAFVVSFNSSRMTSGVGAKKGSLCEMLRW